MRVAPASRGQHRLAVPLEPPPPWTGRVPWARAPAGTGYRTSYSGAVSRRPAWVGSGRGGVGSRQRGRCRAPVGRAPWPGASAEHRRGASNGARPASGSAERGDTSMQIVMAEHDPRQRAQMRQRLEGAGQYEVQEAEDCMLALKLARQQPPDLILMGFGRVWEETVLAVRMLEKDKVAPVLLWTACADSDAIDAAIEAGAVGCLARSCTPKELKAQVESGVARWREKRDLGRRVAALEAQVE